MDSVAKPAVIAEAIGYAGLLVYLALKKNLVVTEGGELVAGPPA
jgi:hypothetical protein